MGYPGGGILFLIIVCIILQQIIYDAGYEEEIF
jgi:hypothetical protein